MCHHPAATTFGALLVAICCLGLAACAAATPAGPTLPLTVAPATVDAWRGGPVTTRLQAAIAAQSALGATRLRYVQPPQVIFVERIDSPAAQRRLKALVVQPPVTNAWLVVFEGDYQIIGPEMPMTPTRSTPTPIPAVHGCAFVILSSPNGDPMSVGTMTTCTIDS